jgi:hypothetical protein
MTSAPTGQTDVGQKALYAHLGLAGPEPTTKSRVSRTSRRTVEHRTYVDEYYPLKYQTDGSLIENLRFALKYEPLELRIILAALEAIGSRGLEEWVRSEPTGEYSRRAWFLYETLTGEPLDLPPAKEGKYVVALDERRQYTAAPQNSTRHRVRDNLLGGRCLCPTVRKTSRLKALESVNLAAKAAGLSEKYPTDVLARAVRFLYTKETRSSFAIEGEVPDSGRELRFVAALRQVGAFDSGSKAALLELQRTIVDPRYADNDWRTSQNFVAEATQNFGQRVHFICARPEDVPSLMEGWSNLVRRVLDSTIDPVVGAAAASFAFVFIHPFEDGNGRTHRFLIHDILAKRSFSPPDFIFPVSAAMLRRQNDYERALEAFSDAVMPSIQWHWTPDSEVVVENDTRDLYGFFDATPQAEFLYECVAETIEVDLKSELDFLMQYDAAYEAVTRVVDMPNRRAALLVRLLLQNHGELSQRKRAQFSELTEDELRKMEAAVKAILGEEAAE